MILRGEESEERRSEIESGKKTETRKKAQKK